MYTQKHENDKKKKDVEPTMAGKDRIIRQKPDPDGDENNNKNNNDGDGDAMETENSNAEPSRDNPKHQSGRNTGPKIPPAKGMSLSGTASKSKSLVSAGAVVLKRAADEQLSSPHGAKRERIDNNNNNNNDEHTDPRIEELVARIRNFFSDTDPTMAPIDVEQAINLLEASSGNVEMAASFYWEEYFASTAPRQYEKTQLQPQPQHGNRAGMVVGKGSGNEGNEKPMARSKPDENNTKSNNGGQGKSGDNDKDGQNSEGEDVNGRGNHSVAKGKASTGSKPTKRKATNPSEGMSGAKLSPTGRHQRDNDADHDRGDEGENDNDYDSKANNHGDGRDGGDAPAQERMQRPANLRGQQPGGRRPVRQEGANAADKNKRAEDGGEEQDGVNRGGDDDDNDGQGDGDGDGDGDGGDYHVQHQPNNENGEDGPEDGQNDHYQDNNDDIDVDDDDDDEDIAQRIQNLPLPGANGGAAEIPDGDDNNEAQAGGMAGSVSVSDDEGASGSGVYRLLAHRRRPDDDPSLRGSVRGLRDLLGPNIRTQLRNRNLSSTGGDPDGSMRDSLSENDDDDNNDDDDDDIEYFSDDEWLLGIENGTTNENPPSGTLWGLKRKSSRGGQRPDSVVDDEDDEVDDEENEDGSPVPVIARTWLNAGFSMAPCGTGFTLRGPTENDISNHKRRLAQGDGGNDPRFVVMPPHHCKSVTAIMSLVTAVMYSGASVHGEQILFDCNKKPFGSLTETERKQQFESRFADALAALFLVAFQASCDRKRNVLKKRKALPTGESEVEKVRTQMIQRRLKLIPTCRWPPTASGTPKIPDGRDVFVCTSVSNIDDLNHYVRSNIKSFTNKGGCSLFLEMILRIHGSGAISRILRRSQEPTQSSSSSSSTTIAAVASKANATTTTTATTTTEAKTATTTATSAPETTKASSEPSSTPSQLICCTCEERQKKVWDAAKIAAVTQNEVDTTPPGCQCMTIELLSLLLTGQIHSNLNECKNELKVGILDGSTPPEKQLQQDNESVWIVRGEECFSLLWLADPKDKADIDRAGQMVEWKHWNCWYGQQHLSDFRMVTPRQEWSPPMLLQKKASPPQRRTVLESIVGRRKEAARRTATGESTTSAVVSSDDAEIELDPAKKEVTKEEMSSMKEHPSDRTFYPNQFKRWRYDPDGSGTWTLFHFLSKRQQIVVETKLAPRINTVLRRRWPNATVTHPPNSNPIV